MFSEIDVDKEYTFKEVAELQKKFGVVRNGEDEEDDENDWDVQVNDADQAFKDLLGVRTLLVS